MRRFLLAAVFAAAALHARAFEYCDDVDKPREMMRDAKTWHQDLRKKRYQKLDGDFAAMVDEAQAASADGKAERALRIFEKLDEWRETRHRDWQEAYPRSAAAWLAGAHFHLGRALSLGPGATGGQGEDDGAVMRSELAAAREMAGRADRLLRAHSLTDALRIRIAAAEDGHAAAMKAVQDAVRDSPRSLAVRMAEIEAQHEDRGGKRADLVAVPKRATALSAADRRFLEYLVFHHLGETDLKAGRRSAALGHLARAQPLCPALSPVTSRLAELYLEDRRYAAVLPLAEEIVRAYPTDGLGYVYRGRARRGLGRHAEALADLRHGVELGRNEAFPELAWYYETGSAGRRDLAKALELYAVGEARNVAGAAEGAQRVRAALAKEGG